MSKHHSKKSPASPWKNPVKAKLEDGKSVFGLVISVGNSDVAAHAAALGFDYLWIEMEHSAIGLESLRNMVLATRGLPTIPFARPPVNEIWTAKRVLDAGALGVIFPFTSNAALARQAVAACRYPPKGRRGFGPDLAAFRWPPAVGYPDFADQNVLVVTIIENLEGLENVEEIAATPGIDVIFIGTYDLSFALGLRGNQDHPRLRKAVESVVTAAQKHGKRLGRPAATVAQVRQWQADGFQFFVVGSDLGFMQNGAAAFLEPMGRLIKAGEVPPTV